MSIINSTEAEYGRSSGATVNIVTRSGTNAIHEPRMNTFATTGSTLATIQYNDQPQDVFRTTSSVFLWAGPSRKTRPSGLSRMKPAGNRRHSTVARVPTTAEIATATATMAGW